MPRSNTFDELKTLSDRFANALLAAGAQRGDRIGIFLSQSIETAIAHVAAYKAGMVAVPLFALFGVDAIAHRLGDSGAVALITDHAGVQKVDEIRAALPALRNVFSVDIDEDQAGSPAPVRSFWHALNQAIRRLHAGAHPRGRPCRHHLHRAPPVIQRARCTGTVYCSDTCPVSRCRSRVFPRTQR